MKLDLFMLVINFFSVHCRETKTGVFIPLVFKYKCQDIQV